MKVKVLASCAFGLGLALASGATPGCNCSQNNQNTFHPRDLGSQADLSIPVGGDGFTPNPDGGQNACGDFDPSCTTTSVGPSGNPPSQFPLPTDDPPPSNVGADGVGRDPMGALVLDSSHANFDFLWVADDMDYNVGFISKISTKPRSSPPPGAINGRYSEVARYVTVTCSSDPNSANWPDRSVVKLGNNTAGPCDGTKGCCSNAPAGQRGAINLSQNRPSRTAVDFNGDVWVSNRAFNLQSSVSKIANSVADCIDRNKNGKIDTSGDFDGDGIIDTDCNNNNVPDDLIDTDPAKGGTACANGKKQEFFGLDDECILFTTNTGAINGWGRPLALGASTSGDIGPSDAWAGRYQDGVFYRIDGKTGYVKTTVTITPKPDPNNPTNMVSSHPYGAAVDQFGILWAPNIDGHYLFYFDTADPNNPNKQGIVAPPTSGANNISPDGNGFYGISLDGYTDSNKNLVQQVWLAHYGGSGGGFRYRPKRTNNFADLAAGTWAWVKFAGTNSQGLTFAGGNGRGIAVDNRTPAFAWVGIDSSPGAVGRIPDDIADGVTTSTDFFFTKTSTVDFSGNTTLGVGVANDLDIWGANQGQFAAGGEGGSVTHFSVAKNGDLTPADRVELDDHPAMDNSIKPHPYTYSDFTGFGLRNFTNPRGFYQWTETGCSNGAAGKTKWLKVLWDADVPPNTAIQVKVRSADDPASLNAATWSAPYTMSPADLQIPPALMPNPSGYLQVEFDLSTTVRDATPRLKGFQILHECPNGIG